MILRRVIHHFRKQEWAAIALDFLIVVFGILLAFQITEWNETRRERALEQDYLQRIVTELDRSIESMHDSIETSKEREALGQFLMRSINEQEIVKTDPGRFIYAVLTGGYTYSPMIC